MKPHEEEMVRSLVRSLLHTAETLDQLLNQEPEPEPEPTKPRARYLGDDEPTPGA